MLRYPQYYKRHGVRRWTEVAGPRLSSLVQMTLPRESIFHYLPQDEIELGIPADDPIIANSEHFVFVDHARDLTVKEGNPRWNKVIVDTEVRNYHRRNRRVRRTIKLDTPLREPKTLLVRSYALLGRLYRYTASIYSKYYHWHNIQCTLWDNVAELAEISDRQQFIRLNLPRQLPALSHLRAGETKLSGAQLRKFNSPELLTILDLWKWLGEHRADSTMNRLPLEILDRINLMWMDGTRWFVINLGKLNSYRTPTDKEVAEGAEEIKGKESLMVQKHVLRGLMSLMEARTGGAVLTEDVDKVEEEESESTDTKPTITSTPVEDEEDVVEDVTKSDDVEKEAEITSDLDQLEDLEQLEIEDDEIEIEPSVAEKDLPPEEAVQHAIDELAEQGQLSGAEYRRLEKLATRYKELPNPLGEGTLEDLVTIDPKDLEIKETTIPDIETVTDKSMLKSSLKDFDQRYIEEIMDKDVAGMVLNLQKSGIVIAGYDVDEVRDAVNHYQVHKIRIVPVKGAPSTIEFKLPVVKSDGTYRASGVDYVMRKQRGDVPIRKVSPARVALTSYYGKLFVDRSDRSTANVDRWLANKITELAMNDESEAIAELQPSTMFDHTLKLPRIYSSLAKRFKSFSAGIHHFYLDYHTRKERLGAEAVEAAEQDGMVAIGSVAKDIMVVDQDNTFYLVKGGNQEVLGKISDVVGPDLGQPPLELAELKVFNKAVPVGLALGYLLGIDRLIARLGLEPRRVGAGQRMDLGDDEYPVRFKDETLIFHRDNALAAMIMAGFLRFGKDVRQYSYAEFNRKDVYSTVMEANGLQGRYVRELDLLTQLFVDPITKELLVEMKEPTVFADLIFRSCELLMTDWHPEENDMSYQRIKGYERFAGAVYGELVRSMRVYHGKPASAKAKVEMNPQAVWMGIMKDPAHILVNGSGCNPINNLKEKEAVTFTGAGGRTPRSMVARTRTYGERDMGVISEATVDSGDVAVHTFLTPDANFTSLRGMTKPYDPKEDGPAKLISTSALLAPAADRDD